MSTIMIKVPKDKTMELKQMIKEGLHIFGRAMSVAEQMCEEAEMGERYGMRGGYGERGYDIMGERDYPMDERYGDRRGRSATTGRYVSY